MRPSGVTILAAQFTTSAPCALTQIKNARVDRAAAGDAFLAETVFRRGPEIFTESVVSTGTEPC
jgi:hypothetical protein